MMILNNMNLYLIFQEKWSYINISVTIYFNYDICPEGAFARFSRVDTRTYAATKGASFGPIFSSLWLSEGPVFESRLIHEVWG